MRSRSPAATIESIPRARGGGRWLRPHKTSRSGPGGSRFTRCGAAACGCTCGSGARRMGRRSCSFTAGRRTTCAGPGSTRARSPASSGSSPAICAATGCPRPRLSPGTTPTPRPGPTTSRPSPRSCGSTGRCSSAGHTARSSSATMCAPTVRTGSPPTERFAQPATATMISSPAARAAKESHGIQKRRDLPRWSRGLQPEDRLCLSIRTVERHLTNIYAKLHVSGKAGRAAAAALFVQLHQPPRFSAR